VADATAPDTVTIRTANAPTSPPAPAVASPSAKQTTWTENAPFALMMVITFGLFASIAMLMFRVVPPENHDILISVTSSIATVWIAGGAYFFGSNAMSKVKDTALATAVAAMPVPDKTTTTTIATTAVPVVSVKPVEQPPHA
jgi:hypothetical protein